MTDSRKYSESLVSCLSHLVGLRKDAKDGKLRPNMESKRKNRCDFVNIENVNVQFAQQWEAGSMLNSVSELGYVPEADAKRIRTKLSLRNNPKCAPTAQSVVKKQSINHGSSNSNQFEPNSAVSRPATRTTGGSNLSDGRNQIDVNMDGDQYASNRPFVQGPAGFLPPRKVNVNSAINGTRNVESKAQDGQRNKFSFKARQDCNEETTAVALRPVTPSTSLFSSLESSKNSGRTVEPVPGLANNRVPPVLSNANAGSTRNPNIGNQGNSFPAAATSAFKTAYEQLAINDQIKGVQRNLPPSGANVHVSGIRKTIKPEMAKIVKPPSKDEDEKAVSDNPEVNELMEHESMKNVDPRMVEAILNEVVQIATTDWDDIAGLHGVKSIIREIIVWPMLRPDIFKGLRSSPRGILLFGPPGTGKTMFGRLIATQSESTFFNISASSLTSKWIGDGEKMVRALFQVARLKQPAVIFIDEIDSILTQRSDTEHESSRRLKTEFLIQFDGCATQTEDRILVIGVTNRPQELDEAARRRLVKRIYIPLPDLEGRKQLVKNLLREYSSELSDDDFNSIAEMTEGYSGADMNSLCKEAAYGPIRDVCHLLQTLDASHVRPMQMKDFIAAHRLVKSSVGKLDVELYEGWDATYGCHV
ncbi:unnamed protein product [Orchesella dallaii]|uniref:AAA+ ATPase domain-containing protein n=1 Tax=Orchesella dallaii TaxID=48710 RepID=A0ABP1PT64_9HEXA